MKIYEENNNLIIEDAVDFDIAQTFDCGQCFRWNRQEDGSYFGIALNRTLRISQSENRITLFETGLNDYNEIWKGYFDLERDYSDIKNKLSDGSVMSTAISFGSGIRILAQDSFECLISFIISASNNIPRIKKIIELLCANFGEEIGSSGHHTFPTPEKIAELSLEDLAVIKAGFRDKYILSAAKAVTSGMLDINALKNASFDYAKSELLKIPGVGEKVAGCILLFGLCKYSGFPIDVWVKRIMEYCYFENEVSKEVIARFAKDKFGELSGFAQQYLFYWARENKIGI